jgi:phosphoribosylamine--glycine ligase
LQDICRKYNIPTAAYETFTDAAAAKEYIKQIGEATSSTSVGLRIGVLEAAAAEHGDEERA